MYWPGTLGNSLRVVAAGRFVNDGSVGNSVNVVAAGIDGRSVIGMSNVGIM